MLALHTVFYSWAFLESRRLVQVIPEDVRKLWSNWEIRVLVLVSLTLQLCLLHFGCRRRYSARSWLGVFLWLSYLGADSVATVALGVISNYQGNCDDSQLQNELIAFWAPFLLMHLGGQDTITAYAVQDNELWLRHLLGLVVQSGVSIYIILLFWRVSWLSFLTIPLFLAGFIKYAERIWVMKSANNDISFDGYWYSFMGLALGHNVSGYDPSSRNIKIAIFYFFKIVRCLFLNQKINLPSGFYELSYSDFCDSKTAWNTIEVELGYAYDVYYTKAPLFFSTWGFLIRIISFTSILCVSVLFLVKESHRRPLVDLIVTYLLLGGAILMEIYGVVLLCASDWLFHRSGNELFDKCIEALLTPIRSGFAKLSSKQRWSNSMCQLDLLDLCLGDKSLQDVDGTPTLSSNFRGWALNRVLPKLNGELQLQFYMTHQKVTAELKSCVYTKIGHRGWNSNGFSVNYDKFITDGDDSIETYQSIIIWHIATDLCFYTDYGRNVSDLWQEEMIDDHSNLGRAVSKGLSDYMMYILVTLPLVLSTGNAKRIFERTCNNVKFYIGKKGLSKLSKVEVCKQLFSLGFRSHMTAYEALSEDKLFRLGVLLAQKLRRSSEFWPIVSSFWCDHLVYVATLSQGNNHAQLLRNGGEFLTHVWLLEEHCNLSIRAERASFERKGTGIVSFASYDAAVVEEEAVAAVPEGEAVVGSVVGDDVEEAVVSSVAGDDAAVVEEESEVSSVVGDDESAV